MTKFWPCDEIRRFDGITLRRKVLVVSRVFHGEKLTHCLIKIPSSRYILINRKKIELSFLLKWQSLHSVEKVDSNIQSIARVLDGLWVKIYSWNWVGTKYFNGDGHVQKKKILIFKAGINFLSPADSYHTLLKMCGSIGVSFPCSQHTAMSILKSSVP